MKVLICGMDGYIGWNLAMYLSKAGHEVHGFDNMFRRNIVRSMGCSSLTQVRPIGTRLDVWKRLTGWDLDFSIMDITDHKDLMLLLYEVMPDTIIHLAEIPSAPYSMQGINSAVQTQQNNIIGTLKLLWAMDKVVPEAHLIKLGTMGEWGSPNLDIPEGYFDVEYRGRKDTLPFPKVPGSFYHATKCADTININFACRTWGLRVSDLMQGPVFGISTRENTLHQDLVSRFDYDGCWGTVINRYAVQAALGYALTPYGKGGQKKGYIHITDTLQCIETAMRFKPSPGKHEIYNQFDELHTVNELADIVQSVCGELGLPEPPIKNVDNPRVEKEDNYYNPDNEKLKEMGVKYLPLWVGVKELVQDVDKLKDYIKPETIQPTIFWRTRK